MPLTNLHAEFLATPAAYAGAEDYWRGIWEQASEGALTSGWRTGWLSTGSPEIRDGNPIFSAVSAQLKRAVRVIQHPPSADSRPHVAFWIDTIGGHAHSPGAVTELVVSCAPCIEI